MLSPSSNKRPITHVIFLSQWATLLHSNLPDALSPKDAVAGKDRTGHKRKKEKRKEGKEKSMSLFFSSLPSF
jgi:hypothetical protein